MQGTASLTAGGVTARAAVSRRASQACCAKPAGSAGAPLAAAASLLLAGPAAAAEQLATLGDSSAVGTTLGGATVLAGLAYLLISADPAKRCVLPP